MSLLIVATPYPVCCFHWCLYALKCMCVLRLVAYPSCCIQHTPAFLWWPPSRCHIHHITGWQRLIGCRKLQVISCKKATNYLALLWKMTGRAAARRTNAAARHQGCAIRAVPSGLPWWRAAASASPPRAQDKASCGSPLSCVPWLSCHKYQDVGIWCDVLWMWDAIPVIRTWKYEWDLLWMSDAMSMMFIL